MEVKYDYIRKHGAASGCGKIAPGIYYKPKTGQFVTIVGCCKIGEYSTKAEAEAALEADRKQFAACRKAPKEKQRKPVSTKVQRFDDLEHCLKCKYHDGSGVKGDKSKTSPVHCNYLEITGISRVKLHYERTGKESLEGMTHGYECTEFEPIQKRGARNG